MRAGKKISGGRYKKFRKKKLFELKNQQRFALLGEEKKKITKMRYGRLKFSLLRVNKANVMDPKTHKAQISLIKNVLEVPSNKFLARKNVIVKGAIIETELGKARVTSRPSQHGQINAILIS
ncbi:MAG: 30S ribosomal protein S8e [Candidatus Pacearchaeota archaeon]